MYMWVAFVNKLNLSYDLNDKFISTKAFYSSINSEGPILVPIMNSSGNEVNQNVFESSSNFAEGLVYEEHETVSNQFEVSNRFRNPIFRQSY